MDEITFSDAQRALIEKSGSVYVPACPGAGKTQSIVERFIERPGVTPRKGVALLSFTNAAINEARQRCARRPELLTSPNFVGTIDSFINRFIVSPLYVALTRVRPTFKDSWETVQGTAFKVGGVEFRLSWFSFDHDGGNGVLIEHKMSYMESRAVAALTQQQRTAAASYATNLVRLFAAHGVMDCAATRVLMQHYLSDQTNRDRLGELFVARFGLVIVDEVQDCSDSDIFLVDFLLDLGIEVVVVGDLDQSIYNFRGSSIEAVAKVVARVPEGTRFDGNYRSAPAICKIVNSLRAGNSVDEPVGKWKDDPFPVIVLPVDNLRGVRPKVVEVVESMGFSAGEIKVLSYTKKNARACAGASPPGDKKGGMLVRLAEAAATLRDLRASPRARTEAMQTVEGILRGLGQKEQHALGDADFLESVGLTPRAFREGCLRLACLTSPFEATPSAFRTAIVEGIKTLGWDSWITTSGLRTPSGGTWPVVMIDEPDALDWSTTHGFKGLQAPVVAVAIPASKRPDPYDGVGLWLSGDAGEDRRLLYVAASRAERLLILVTESFQTKRVVSCLERDGVPFEVIERD
ncbi:ATP-dependent helicase [Dactylosporangium sp. AC04546]|uniref:UvrD-helicase domain-containing protein n=1 Tax=Dactylosporangium sp. AC04546 TaxID=2862460 RepID=UPI001EDFABC4|nr:ATP-dependent helicase [Dactylosporangium sp. AC04546]WVK78908.1 ATP-dependent helicase [Dactylosporangium sp. AC04546]